MPALLCEALVPQPCGTTHVERPCFQGLQADACTSFPRACSVAVFCRGGHLVCKASLLSAVSRHDVLRLLQPSLHVLTRCLVISGHHSTNPAQSTGPRNWWSPSCRVVAAPGVAPASTSRQLTLLTHLETHLEAFFADTPCQLISIFASKLSCLTNNLIISSLFADSSRSSRRGSLL